MHVDISREPKLSKADHLFVFLAEGDRTLEASPGLRKLVEGAVGDADFSGRSDEVVTLVTKEPRRTTLIGLGKRDKLSVRGLKAALFQVGKLARKQRSKNVVVIWPYAMPQQEMGPTLRLVADMLSHSDYKYDAFITVKKDEKRYPIDATLVAPPSIDAKLARALASEARAISDGVRTVRDLGNAPCNVMTPTAMARRAEEVAKEVGVRCTVFGKKEIERMKMGGLLAVNRGSVEEPRFVVLEYTPRKAKTHVALVGKGITFDSGGISIKPAEKMEEMKFDMCGAAAVIGTVEAAAKLGLPVKVTGIFASTDNLPSGSAYKPGEIITMMNGKTVEIVNTDAEGRMILGDALHYASNLKPDHILDYATLTGACVVALSSEAAGIFTADDELARKLIECGERTGDRFWRLPLWDEYKDQIRSEWADMKNSGGRWGGANTAAIFLKEFVDCRSWAHLDIAGTAYADSETSRDARGATGAGVRATIGWLESLSD